MAKTAIADVIIPSRFLPYTIQRTAQLSVFVESGIIGMDPAFDSLASSGGRTVDMPFWNDLSGGRQILSDSVPLNVNKINSGTDIAMLHNDGNAWSVNLLANLLAGDDPMEAIASLLGAYWAREDQTMLLAALAGVFGAFAAEGGTPPNLLSIQSETAAGASETTKLTGLTFVDALLKLGDRADRIVAVAMHSVTEGALRKRDLIDFIPDSEGKEQIRTFQGRRVIVDDTLPVRAGTTDGTVYTTFLFGPGAFGKGSCPLEQLPIKGGFGTEALEFARVALQSDDVMINRRRYILHPRGVKFTDDDVAGEGATNAELAEAANWARVYESKNVRIIAVNHNN